MFKHSGASTCVVVHNSEKVRLEALILFDPYKEKSRYRLKLEKKLRKTSFLDFY